MRVQVSFLLIPMDNQMIHIAVCDDDEAMLGFLKSEIHMAFYKKYDISVKLYTQPQLLMIDANCQRFDLIFIDIEMPDINGFQLADKLQIKIPDAFIVFISNYENFIYSSFEFQPLSFLRKNMIKDELPKVIIRYLKQTGFDRAYYGLPSELGEQALLIRDITYLECNGRKITVNTINHEKIEFIGKLKKHEKELEQYHFIRTHNSYLVSHRHIFSLEEEVVILMDQTKLPVSKHRRKKVKELLLTYIEL